MNATQSPSQTFAILSVFGFFSGFVFICVVTKADFPNSPALEIALSSLVPPVPAALLCAGVGCWYVHGAQRVDSLNSSESSVFVIAAVCAIASVLLTIVGATAIGVSGWATVK